MPHELGLANGGGDSLARPQLSSDAATSRGKSQRPEDPAGP